MDEGRPQPWRVRSSCHSNQVCLNVLRSSSVPHSNISLEYVWTCETLPFMTMKLALQFCNCTPSTKRLSPPDSLSFHPASRRELCAFVGGKKRRLNFEQRFDFWAKETIAAPVNQWSDLRCQNRETRSPSACSVQYAIWEQMTVMVKHIWFKRWQYFFASISRLWKWKNNRRIPFLIQETFVRYFKSQNLNFLTLWITAMSCYA